MKTVNINKLLKRIKENDAKSAWKRGVLQTACDMIEYAMGLHESKNIPIAALHEYLLVGAKDYEQYAWSGRLLVGTQQIMERFCTASELKYFTDKNGMFVCRKACEKAMEIRSRGITQAAMKIKQIANEIAEFE